MSEWKEYKLGEVSMECSHRYSPLRSGGCNYINNTGQQPEGLRHLRMVVAVLQAAFAGGVPLTQGVATGLYLFQPVGLPLSMENRL